MGNTPHERDPFFERRQEVIRYFQKRNASSVEDLEECMQPPHSWLDDSYIMEPSDEELENIQKEQNILELKKTVSRLSLAVLVSIAAVFGMAAISLQNYRKTQIDQEQEWMLRRELQRKENELLQSEARNELLRQHNRALKKALPLSERRDY